MGHALVFIYITMRTRQEWCEMRWLDANNLPSIAHPYEDSDPKKSYIKYDMKDLKTGEVCWYQLRFTNFEYQELKSRTQKWSHVWWYREKIDRKKPIIIVEWEVDFTTVYQLGRNALWIQWVNNLNKTIELLYKWGINKVIILVDTDKAADLAIEKIQNRIIVYDWRYVLKWEKDVNDAFKAWCLLEPEPILNQNLYVKLWAFKVKKSVRPLPDRSIDIMSIDTATVLQELYPQYTIKWDRIYDQWKLSDWYRYWKNQNAVVDFAWKDRPQWNAWSVAYTYFNDKKETANYLKKYM